MPVARCHSFALQGIEGIRITVEVDITPAEKPILVIVGLPDSAVKESKDRVLTALKNVGCPLGNFLCTVNLAPGNLRKEGACYDLPIALGILTAHGKLHAYDSLENYFIAGELSLNGELRPIAGALSLAILAKKQKATAVLIPQENINESAATGVTTYGFKNLKEAIEFFCSPSKFTPAVYEAASTHPSKSYHDLSHVRGQETAKRVLEIAAAGGHNLVLSGPPGSGKSMLAKTLISLLPPLTFQETLETTQIYSIARQLTKEPLLIQQRPFRSPHHTISYAGLVGGGSHCKPGEISLAHNGILFLDELPEFNRSVLEMLRQPLEDQCITISRARQQITYPCRFMCIAAMNPCPCGFLGHPTKGCRDTEVQVYKYRSKISGPLWDRFDLQVVTPPVTYQEMHAAPTGETSAVVRQRIESARERQYQRQGEGITNAMLSRGDLHNFGKLSSECQTIMKHAMDGLGISARAADRLHRVAITIADLEECSLLPDHLMEALSYRTSLLS